MKRKKCYLELYVLLKEKNNKPKRILSCVSFPFSGADWRGIIRISNLALEYVVVMVMC
jgi:hypothetical protein